MMQTVTITALLAMMALGSAEAQRREETSFLSVEAPNVATGARDTTDHPTGRRMTRGFWLGVGTGYAALHTPAWVTAGLAGYFGGVVVGSALVGAKNCGFVKRLGVSLMGGLAGAAVSYFVASRTYLAKDVEAVAATIVVGGAPVAGAAIALRRCD